MTSSSAIEPPVWMMALTPALAAKVTVSALGKKASEARQLPLASLPALRIARIALSTRDVSPIPIPIVLVPLVRTMALDFTNFTTHHPKSIESSSALDGFFLVTTLISAGSRALRSVSWRRSPPGTFLRSYLSRLKSSTERATSLRFFFCVRMSSAALSKAGAITHSMKPLFEMASAVLTSTSRLRPMIPPKADRLSQAKAALNAFVKSLSVDTPDGLLCLITAAAGSPKA